MSYWKDPRKWIVFCRFVYWNILEGGANSIENSDKEFHCVFQRT